MTDDNDTYLLPFDFLFSTVSFKFFSTPKSIRTEISFVHLVSVMILCITFPGMYYIIAEILVLKRESEGQLSTARSQTCHSRRSNGVSHVPFSFLSECKSTNNI